MSTIHQFVAGFSHGDAISNEAIVMRDIFRKWGYESGIFSEAKRILPELRPISADVSAFKAVCKPEDVVLLHLSIGSPVNDVFAELPCRKAILYHNITPPEFFLGVQEQIANNLRKGREQAARLAGSAEVVMADSGFNGRELEQFGYHNVKVLPLVLDIRKLRDKANRKTLRKYRDGLVNIVFVGRCVPNKRIEDCLSAFYYFQKFVEPSSRFIHVGSYAGTEQYHALLFTYLRELQLENVDLLGAVRQDELNAVYQAADVFLCMSEHEGFCIPVIEAMVNKVPVLAYDCAAVPETLDGAGILFSEKRFDLIAEMIGQLVRDQSFRRNVIAGQDARISRYEQRDLEGELREHLAPLL
ncbi:MAG: glycosyltransferase family 4 protein [Verrucomicrobia bacterium]|nr:glycosyltransferase family 4 protein [Verrucomicrobiota bacterium]